MLLLKNGWPFTKDSRDTARDILIDEGRIVQIAPGLEAPGARVIDASRKLVLPGLVDLHVHLREPGGEHKETIATGTKAAARGGFTTILAMPNTSPPLDNPERLQDVMDRIEQKAQIHTLPLAAITRGQQGKELTDMKSLAEGGAFGFSDDGKGVQSARLSLEAMQRAARLNRPILAHCEEESLVAEGGRLSDVPPLAEAVPLARDLLLAAETGVHYHACHVSCRQSVNIIRQAKSKGARITAEVTPHHLLLTAADIPGEDPNFKMNPPLREEADRQVLIAALKDGTIDAIATDHAPHSPEEKGVPWAEAPCGVVGLETAFPLLYTHLVKPGLISLDRLVELMAINPRTAFSLPGGMLEPGAPADITVIDLDREETVDPKKFASRGRNTPFAGWRLAGWPTLTICGGEIVWERGNDQP